MGAGPAGVTVGAVLRAAGVDCLVLETESRAFIEQRPRAGVIEEWAVRGLEQRGLAGNLSKRAERHTECEFRFDGRGHRFACTELTGHHHWVYPQPLHNYVVEPMVFGRLFLAGDAAHLVAPIATKGLNLALHDAFLLGDALVARLTRGDATGLEGCSDACLRRVWDYQEFSEWLSGIYHGTSWGDPYRAGTTLARLRRLFTSPVAAAAFAEQYLGTADAF